MATSKEEDATRPDWFRTFFKHGSNLIIVLGILGFTVALDARRTLGPMWPFVVAGGVVFLVSEYLTHRFTLHAEPVKNPFIGRLQRRLHYDHHVEPDRLDLLFLPPWFLFPAIAIYGTLYFFLTGSLDAALAILLGNLIGLLHYERVHYIAHIPVTPGSAWGKYMKKVHLWHHYKNEHYWFGVTNPLGDHLFGTWKEPTEVDKSGTTRDLFGANR